VTCRTRGKSALPLDSPDRMPGRFSPAKSRSGHQLKAGLGRASAWLTAVRIRKNRVPTRGAGSDARNGNYPSLSNDSVTAAR